MPGFMIQGGGHTVDLQKKRTKAPIINEASNGLSNVRGSISMARKPDPDSDSATAQFFINVVDNGIKLDYTGPTNPGYAVFGKVIEGMEVVDKIVGVKTATVGGHQNVPVEPVVIEKALEIPK